MQNRYYYKYLSYFRQKPNEKRFGALANKNLRTGSATEYSRFFYIEDIDRLCIFRKWSGEQQKHIVRTVQH